MDLLENWWNGLGRGGTAVERGAVPAIRRFWYPQVPGGWGWNGWNGFSGKVGVNEKQGESGRRIESIKSYLE